MGSVQSRRYYVLPVASIAIIVALMARKYFKISLVSGYRYKLRGKKRTETARLRNYRVHNGRIKMITRAEQCEAELSAVDWEDMKIVGLDCEWSRRPIALLQLALPDGTCFLIHLCRMKTMPPTLESFLANKSILKFGVEVGNDAKRIQKMYNCVVTGCVDLRNLAVRSGMNVEDHLSLKALTRLLLGLELPKAHYVRCSNWESHQLSNSQKHYAAADAAVALDIVDALVKKKLQAVEQRESATNRSLVQPRPPIQVPRPFILAQLSHHHPIIKCCDRVKPYQESPVSAPPCSAVVRYSKEFYSCLFSMCQGLVDLPYRHRPYIPSTASPNHKIPTVKAVHIKAGSKPAGNMVVRQSPYYHNCKLLSPDGSLLAIVDRKKLDWYIQRDLGEIVSESPPTLRLYFEPKGKPQEDRKFYLAQKEDQCVVCGAKQQFNRKHVIPLEYRKHFPAGMKDHLSHDVLLLCPDCHRLSCQHDNYYREYLASYHNAPINSDGKQSCDVWLQQVKNHARALSSHHKIPEARMKELMQTLKTYFNAEDVTEDMIREAAGIDPRMANESYISHGQKVVEEVTHEGKLIEFQQSWRRHFLDSMKPKFLPPLWSIDHNPTS